MAHDNQGWESLEDILVKKYLSQQLQQLCYFEHLTECISPKLRIRFLNTTLPQLARIRLLHPGDPERLQKASETLYLHYFGGDEAEDLIKIRARQKDMDLLTGSFNANNSIPSCDSRLQKYGLSRYYQLAAFNGEDQLVGQSFFSLLPTAKNQMSIYLQYICVVDNKLMETLYHVRPQHDFRGLGIAALLQYIALGVAGGYGRLCGHPTVVGTIFESEMKGQASSEQEIRYTYQRLRAHTQSGAKVVMLEGRDGCLRTPHRQPRLGSGQEEVMMHLLIRPTPEQLEARARMTAAEQIVQTKDIMMAYLENFDREGFDPHDVERTRIEVLQRFQEAKAVKYLVEEEVADICELAEVDEQLAAQVATSYGGIDAQRRHIAQALARKA